MLVTLHHIHNIHFSSIHWCVICTTLCGTAWQEIGNNIVFAFLKLNLRMKFLKGERPTQQLGALWGTLSKKLKWTVITLDNNLRSIHNVQKTIECPNNGISFSLNGRPRTLGTGPFVLTWPRLRIHSHLFAKYTTVLVLVHKGYEHRKESLLTVWRPLFPLDSKWIH